MSADKETKKAKPAKEAKAEPTKKAAKEPKGAAAHPPSRVNLRGRLLPHV